MSQGIVVISIVIVGVQNALCRSVDDKKKQASQKEEFADYFFRVRMVS